MKKKTFIVQLLDSRNPNKKSFTQVEDALFYSNDTDASLVFIPHEDSFDFQSAKVVMYNHNDKSLVERNMVVTSENGRKVASYELPYDIMSHWGEWVAQPVFISGGEIYSGVVVSYSISRYLMDNRPPTLTETVTVSNFIQESQTIINEAIAELNAEINKAKELIVSEPNLTMVQIIDDNEFIKIGQRIATVGYYEAEDGGQAEYIIEDVEYPWSVPLGEGKFANIRNADYVSYRMFGAKLDGTKDDTPLIKKAHLYADSKYYIDSNNAKVFTCDVVNNTGIIHITDTIRCSSNVDLSGSTLIVDDTSSAWFGSYVWGQNSGEYYSMSPNNEMKMSLKEGRFKLDGMTGLPDNTVLALEETHYEIRDDDGYLYDVNKGELMVHRQKGIFSTPLGSDWSDAGGTIVFAETDREFLTTDLSMSYTYIPTQHREFIGCNVIFRGNANNYSTVIWVRGHNCTVKDFTFTPEEGVSSNTQFKNSMIYVWGSHKVTIKNCNGFNASGMISDTVENPTSGYAIRGYQTSDLIIEDCDIIGIWGSISVSSSKNVHINRTTANRIDVHDYIVNLFVSNCVVYHHSLQIGSWSGILSVVNTIFYNQYLSEERYPSSHLIALQAGYGRVFSGKIFIQNVKYVLSPEQTSKTFSLVKVNFSPDARSVEKSFEFPQITVDDFELDTVNADDITINALSVTGDVKRTTASTQPPVTGDVAYSGDTKWKAYYETKDFIDKDYLHEGEIIRKFDRSLNSAGKTAFYNIQYYQVLETGTYSINPSDYTEKPITALRRLYAPYYLPGANYNTVEDENFVIVAGSKFFPEIAFTGNTGSKTYGNYPTHKSGTQWVGASDGLEGMYLKYEKSNIRIPDWTPNMVLTQGQYYMMDTKLFVATQAGTTSSRPLESPEWLKSVDYGTAKVMMVGGLWVQGLWLPEGGKAVTYTRPGYTGSDFTYEMYTVVERDGRALGEQLVVSSGLLLDGGVIWRKTDEVATVAWQADTEYQIGDLVLINNVAHKCEYVQIIKMPMRLAINKLSHSSNLKPYVFNFDSTSDISTEGELKVVIDSLEEYEALSRYDIPFFNKEDNPQAKVVQIENDNNLSKTVSTLDETISTLEGLISDMTLRIESLEEGAEVIFKTFTFTKGVNRWDLARVNKDTNIDVGRLDIVNNNDFAVEYNIYESYGAGEFTWTQVKTIPLEPGESAVEHIKLSGTRNDFVIQTRNATEAIDAPDSILTLTFSNLSNKQVPTIELP